MSPLNKYDKDKKTTMWKCVECEEIVPCWIKCVGDDRPPLVCPFNINVAKWFKDKVKP